MFSPDILRHAAGDEQVFVDLLDIFVRIVPPMNDRLRQAFKERHPADIAQEAHSMKSSLAMVGAPALAERCARYELAARRDACSPPAPEGLAVCADIDRVVTQVRAFRDTYRHP